MTILFFFLILQQESKKQIKETKFNFHVVVEIVMKLEDDKEQEKKIEYYKSMHGINNIVDVSKFESTKAVLTEYGDLFNTADQINEVTCCRI